MRSAKKLLYKLIGEKKILPDDAMLIFKEIQSEEKYMDDDIAIIGMSCRLPKAVNIEEYWNNIKSGMCCISGLPENRKKAIESLMDEEQKNRAAFNDGGYIDGIDEFDAAFFRLSQKEAKYMEPEQRKLLEVVWETIEDAGYAKKIYDTNTGVFIGHDHVAGSAYRNYTGGLANEDTLALTGTYPSILSSRISYILDLHGPSVVLDTACSSGLVALHQACQSIRNRECDGAIVGGVSLQVWPVKYKSFKMVETSNYIVRTFDKNSNGTLWGEGVCAVLLKPLAKALKDKDNIHAVIKGSAINNDGIASGITAPNAQAQEDVIIRAWENAKVEVESISYIETHGTGTILGDPIEIKALKNAFSQYTDKRQFCAIGSLKPSIGHLVSASGMASLLKVILAMKHCKMPATINFTEPNPYINFCDSQMYLNDRLRDWEAREFPRRAGISSFGFSGTNCHVVLEEAPRQDVDSVRKEDEEQMLALSAKSSDALNEIAGKYMDFFDNNTGARLEDICYTANTGRCHYEYRLAIIAKSVSEIREKLAGIVNKNMEEIKLDGVFYGKFRVVNKHKDVKLKDEITENEIQQLATRANEEIKQLVMDGKDRKQIIERICRYYAGGADIDWHETLYENRPGRRISLPLYPLRRLECWYYPEKRKGTEKAGYGDYPEAGLGKHHPMLGRCIAETMDSITYCNLMYGGSTWVTDDHKLMGKRVIPGTAYLEMARKACEGFIKTGVAELRDFVFYSPFFLDDDCKREIYTVVSLKKDYAEVSFCSKPDGRWIRHAEGRVAEARKSAGIRYDIEKIADRCRIGEKKPGIKDKTAVSEFGPRWDNIRSVLEGDGEILAAIEIPRQFEKDLDQYLIHPAMADNAVNIMIRMNEKEVYAPFRYGKIKLSDRMPARFYSYIRKNASENAKGEIIALDISFLDESGKVFAEIENYAIKKVHEKDLKIVEKDIYFDTGWVLHSSEREVKAQQDNGSVVVFKDDAGMGDGIISELRKEREVIEVQRGIEYEELDDNAFIADCSIKSYGILFERIKSKGISQIIHLQSISKQKEIESVNMLEDSIVRGVKSLFCITKAITTSKLNRDIDIVLVSDYVNEVTEEEERLNPHNAPLFGLANVVRQEYPDIKCRCIDVDTAISISDLLREIRVGGCEDRVAYRNGKRYTEVLRKVHMDAIPDEPVEIKDKGVYIITGGTGGLGLEMAAYLASRAKVNLWLTGRTDLPERHQWAALKESNEDERICGIIRAIEKIEAMGAVINYSRADIAKEEEVRKVFDAAREKYGHINGVIHSAGIAGNGFIINKDEGVFDEVISPKIYGTWIIDRVTEKENPDFIIMFSSIIAIMGSAGQGDYAAANSYMESYAPFRNKKGKRTMTISWAPWKETGMAYRNGFNNVKGPFKPLSTSFAVDAFEEALNKSLSRIIIGEPDYEVMTAIKDYLHMNISEEISGRLGKGSLTGKPGCEQDKPKDIDVLLKGRDNGKYTDVEKRTARIWAQVFDTNEIDIYDSFMQMGGDSIIATNLFKIMKEEFGGVIDISDIFTYPTIAQISEYISKETGKKVHSVLTVEEIMNRLARGEITVSEASRLKKELN